MDEKGQGENVAEFIENDQAYDKRKYLHLYTSHDLVTKALCQIA